MLTESAADTFSARHIAHIVLTLDVGGLETLVLNMVQEQKARGHSPRVICLDHAGTLQPRFDAAGIPVEALDRRPGFFDPAVYLHLRRLLRQHDVSIVHTHNQEAHFYGTLAARSVGIRAIVHTQHGLEPPSTFKRRMRNRLTGRLIRRFAGVSEDIVKDALAAHWVPSGRASVLLNGVDTNRFAPDKHVWSTMRMRYDIADDELVLVCVARLAAVKNLGMLLDVCRRLSEQAVPVRLFIVGDGPERGNLEHLVKAYGLLDRVVMAGMQDDVIPFLRMADIFALSSLSEGINVALLEGMACGLCPVVTAVGGNPEVVDDKRNGLLSPAEDSAAFAERIIGLHARRDWMRDLGVAARQTVIDRFSFERMMSHYDALYREALAGC